VAKHKKYYKGEGDGFPPSSGRGEFYEFMFTHGLSMHQKCSNYALINLLFDLCKCVRVIDLFITFSSPHPRALTCPSTLKCCEPGSVPQFLILPLFSPFGFVVKSIKEFGGASLNILNFCSSYASKKTNLDTWSLIIRRSLM